MAITPLEIQKMRFSQKMRGYDSTEVEGFLALLAEDLAGRLAQIEKLERENHYFKQRLEETEHREHQLQQTLLRAQKVSEDITANARREAELTVKEAEMMADKIVQQAVDQSTRYESKIMELRNRPPRAAAEVQEHARPLSAHSGSRDGRRAQPRHGPCPERPAQAA